MRKITKNSIQAFRNNQKFSRSNMQVTVNDSEVRLLLYGNCIAKKDRTDGSIFITDCGWQTPTTKERLNGLPNVDIYQKDNVWYLNGNEWNGEWTKIN